VTNTGPSFETEASRPFIDFVDVTLRLRDRSIFPNSSWRIRCDEHWAILGPNGSGKSTLVRSLWGGTPLRNGRIIFEFADQAGQAETLSPKSAIGYVSFELHQRLMEHEELQEDLREFAGRRDGITTAKEVILSGISANRAVSPADEQRLLETADQLGIRDLLQRGMTYLSTGEMRKILIARALMKSPKLLILDEPFDGLDEAARESLAESIDELMRGPMRVILITHRLEHVLPGITHLLLVKDGKMFLQGPKEEVLTSQNMSQLYGSEFHVEKSAERYLLSYGSEKRKKISPAVPNRDCRSDIPDTLIHMENVTVRYDNVYALRDLSWSMKRGENWAILGPNGSGKSTVLKLILGDNPQGYTNKLLLFGKQKGSGETIWQIKKYIGVVSPEFQIQYRKRMSAYDVIASGFYDSIGLYRYPSSEERAVMDQWIKVLGIGDLAGQNYHQLSYGQKRMLLVARAMVKSPVLLIMDEPCHSLDVLNRRRILKIMETIGETQTNLLYVTNHREEILNCTTHVMLLRNGSVLSQGRKDHVLPNG
jgi:molybdate transport system ATP-binding protein